MQYQPNGNINIGCSPPLYVSCLGWSGLTSSWLTLQYAFQPTADYIGNLSFQHDHPRESSDRYSRHPADNLAAYSNPK